MPDVRRVSGLYYAPCFIRQERSGGNDESNQVVDKTLYHAPAKCGKSGPCYQAFYFQSLKFTPSAKNNHLVTLA